MKKLILLSVLITLFFPVFTSCEKEDVVIVFHRDAIKNAISNAIDEESFGLEKQVKLLSEELNSILKSEENKQSKTSEETKSTVAVMYNYKHNYTMEKINETLFNYVSDSKGEYTTPYMTSNDVVNNTFSLSQVMIENDTYLASGTSTRIGEQISIAYGDWFNSEITLNFETIEINRILGKIKRGTIYFDFNGTSSNGNQEHSSGVITYSDYKEIINYNEN